MKLKLIIIGLLYILFSTHIATAAWVNTTGGDHQGDNWTTSDEEIIGGNHYNISTFTLPAGTTVTLNSTYELEIHATTINILGTLNGTGDGYPHEEGIGAGGFCSIGGCGGGGYGGAGGDGGEGFFTSGSGGIVNGNLSTLEINMGSGGGEEEFDHSQTPNNGMGGGSIYLSAYNILISGIISANGTVGNDGNSTRPEGLGGGSGGGILIKGIYINISGSFFAIGGKGGEAGYTPLTAGSGGGGGGGRIKIFYINLINTSTMFVSGGLGGTAGNDGDPGIVGTIYTKYDSDKPILLLPVDASTIYTTYPPLQSSIVFTWNDFDVLQFRLQVARDESFNLLTVDTHISTNNSSHDLIVNDEYFWRVYSYDGLTYLNVSDTYSFNLTGNTSIANNSVYGVIYGANGDISGAQITISNSSAGTINSMITGSNGYYEFDSLTEGTIYTLTTIADNYQTQMANFNATEEPTIKDFYMLPTDSFFDTENNVKYTVWGFGGYYQNIAVSVYKYGIISTSFTGVTGTDGAVTFDLDETQRYKITFINATQGINKELIHYPVKDSYLIFIAFTNPWSEYEEPINSIIDVSVTTEIINSTAAYINFTYTDSLAETTNVLLYLNQTNQSDIWNQTNLDTHNGLSGNFTSSFIVTNYSGESYFINAIITHTTYGTIHKTYAVGFKDSVLFDGIPAKFFLYLAMFIMIFIAGMFGASSVAPGSMVVCVVGWFFYFIGWFDVIGGTAIIAIGLGFATVISLVANLNKFNKKEGIE